MLRHKLMLILGSLVLGLVVLGVVAVWMLEGVLTDLSHINSEATVAGYEATDLSTQITMVELELHRIESAKERHLDALIEAVDAMDGLTSRLGKHYVVHEPQCEKLYSHLVERLPVFARTIGQLATVEDQELARQQTLRSLQMAAELRPHIMEIARLAHQHAREEQVRVTQRFRNMALGIAAGFLIVINASIVALLRVSMTILRPVDALVEASRQLALGHFEHRVELEQRDEFDELAGAFNHLAQQLQANEQRRLETLNQAGLMLNHELNNAMTTIGLQLRLLSRQTAGNVAGEKCLRQIQESLDRMAKTVEALKHLRRVVLTDYVSGVKMLDLQRSVAEEASAQADVGSESLDSTTLPAGRGTDPQ